MVPGSWGFPQWRGLVGRSSGCFVELVERILCRLYVGPAGLRFGEQIVRAGRKHWEKFWIKLSAPKEGGGEMVEGSFTCHWLWGCLPISKSRRLATTTTFHSEHYIIPHFFLKYIPRLFTHSYPSYQLLHIKALSLHFHLFLDACGSIP